jgi:hypothetical protein
MAADSSAIFISQLSYYIYIYILHHIPMGSDLNHSSVTINLPKFLNSAKFQISRTHFFYSYQSCKLKLPTQPSRIIHRTSIRTMCLNGWQLNMNSHDMSKIARRGKSHVSEHIIWCMHGNHVCYCYTSLLSVIWVIKYSDVESSSLIKLSPILITKSYIHTQYVTLIIFHELFKHNIDFFHPSWGA